MAYPVLVTSPSDLTINWFEGTYEFDLTPYFTGATSYSLHNTEGSYPGIWSGELTAVDGIVYLTIDATYIGDWGSSWAVRGTNATGTTQSSGGFNITILPYLDQDSTSTPSASFSDPSITNSNAISPPNPNYIICDTTGFKIPVSEGLKKQWDGAMVRAKSWEPRQPQDMARNRPERPGHGSPRPEQADSFINPTDGITVSDLG